MTVVDVEAFPKLKGQFKTSYAVVGIPNRGLPPIYYDQSDEYEVRRGG